MNASDIIEKVSKDLGLPKTTVKSVLKATEETVLEGLKSDKYVKFGTLGAFKNAHRNEKEGINPATGEAIVIPAHNTITFKQSATAKRYINE